jgi:hypothetical protein
MVLIGIGVSVSVGVGIEVGSGGVGDGANCSLMVVGTSGEDELHAANAMARQAPSAMIVLEIEVIRSGRRL